MLSSSVSMLRSPVACPAKGSLTGAGASPLVARRRSSAVAAAAAVFPLSSSSNAAALSPLKSARSRGASRSRSLIVSASVASTGEEASKENCPTMRRMFDQLLLAARLFFLSFLISRPQPFFFRSLSPNPPPPPPTRTKHQRPPSTSPPSPPSKGPSASRVPSPFPTASFSSPPWPRGRRP